MTSEFTSEPNAREAKGASDAKMASDEKMDLIHNSEKNTASEPHGIPNPTATPTDNSHDDLRMVFSRNSTAASGSKESPTWQVMPNKKRRRTSRLTDSDDDERNQIQTRNRFTALNNENEQQCNNDDMSLDNNNETETITREPKPPPIFVPDVQSIIDLEKCLERVVSKQQYTHKTMNTDGNIKIMPKDPDSYRKIIHMLNEEKASYHTYQLKQQRAYRIVLRSLHPSTPLEDIKNAISELGHQVRNVSNIRNNKTKTPLPLFFVDLEPSPNNKDIYKIDLLLNAKIKIEPPKKKTRQ